MQRLEGKTAVVTGGTAGIGLAIAQTFVGEGAHVYITGRRQQQLEEAVKSIGASATGVQCDSANPRDIDTLYKQIADDGRRLDVIVANAANGETATLEELTLDQLSAVFDTNVRGTVLTVQKALPLLNDGSSVILIGSLASQLGFVGLGAYAASKAAVRSFARTWANELGGRGIRVNTIAPGAINTPGLARSVGEPANIEVAYSRMAGNAPLKRIGEAEELAGVALFLATSEGTYVTGSLICVDGGRGQI